MSLSLSIPLHVIPCLMLLLAVNGVIAGILNANGSSNMDEAITIRKDVVNSIIDSTTTNTGVGIHTVGLNAHLDTNLKLSTDATNPSSDVVSIHNNNDRVSNFYSIWH